LAVIKVCSGFPPAWPYRERFLAAFAHWPASIELVAADLPEGESIDLYQLSAPAALAADMADGDMIAWLDPDIETIAAVPSYVIPHLIKDADLAFIGREDGQTDLGFWVVRLSDRSRPFLAQLAAGVAWADARGEAELIERDLTPGRAGEVWAQGPLGRYSRRLPRPA
jgi:hypothetical protein